MRYGAMYQLMINYPKHPILLKKGQYLSIKTNTVLVENRPLKSYVDWHLEDNLNHTNVVLLYFTYGAMYQLIIKYPNILGFLKRQ